MQLVWDVREDCPELRDTLRTVESWFPEPLDRFRRQLPLPQCGGAFVSPPFYRPPGSYRCIYYHPRGTRAVVAFKGLEPACAEIDALLSDLRRPCYSPHNVAEHFIFEEHKIPGAVGLAEALHEARRAASIQSAHLRVYGKLARLPYPLFVFRHRNDVERRMLEALRGELSDSAFETAAPWIDAGLGIHVYAYPTPPVRVTDIESLLQGLPFRQRMFALIGMCDVEETIGRWVTAFVRLLYLGVLPGTLASIRSGICCQAQNACIDGGFVDLGSTTPLTALRDDTAILGALQFSTSALIDTIRALIAGSMDSHRPDRQEGRFDLDFTRRYVFARLEAAIEMEARPGMQLNERIARYYTAPTTLDALTDQLGMYFLLETPDFMTHAQNFREFGLSLIAEAKERHGW